MTRAAPPRDRRCAVRYCRKWNNAEVTIISPDEKSREEWIWLKRGYGIKLCWDHWLKYRDLVGQRWQG